MPSKLRGARSDMALTDEQKLEIEHRIQRALARQSRKHTRQTDTLNAVIETLRAELDAAQLREWNRLTSRWRRWWSRTT